MMNDFERLFTLEPRHFPLPTLPFRSDFNGYGVGAKVRLDATPYASNQSGFEICLLESGDDIALFAQVSFDSEGRSAIDVKSRFAGKWSPTVRHIAIGLVIDRAFVLEVKVNSSEFVITVDGFKVTEFVKRCDDVRTVLVTGAILVKEIAIFPSLLYYTPPPDYRDETQQQLDITSALNKLALIPTAPDVTPSNTLFNKWPIEESSQPILKTAVVDGDATGDHKILGLQQLPTTRLAPPRPPPPSLRKHSSFPSIQLQPFPCSGMLPQKFPAQQTPTPGSLLSDDSIGDDKEDYTRSSSSTSCLYPELNTDRHIIAEDPLNLRPESDQTAKLMASKRVAYSSSNNVSDIDGPSKFHSQGNESAEEDNAADLKTYRRFGYYASDRPIAYYPKQNVHGSADVKQSSSRHMGSPKRALLPPSSQLNKGSSSKWAEVPSRQRSYENLTPQANSNVRFSRDAEHKRSSPQKRPRSTTSIYSPVFSTQQLQEKTEAVYNAAKNFLKTSFIKGRNVKQLIRTSLVEPQVLTLIGTPISNAKKFEVGLMHDNDYVMLFSALHNEKCIVLNSTRGGMWQKEERIHRFPFFIEQSFTLEIHAGNPIQIFVNGNFFCEFRLRCELPIDAIKIDNNLRLQQFQIK
ncbi:hypothetical protein Tcan_11113 [Toxocara canis]|uniref:Galectin domain-containing protein n=1 Tax=Toxocara canis TaxID=6265 RepID=A0A0B2VPJ7_TOXCA|nr:hypothetical protein Tcan_11113 [Toxocara canis]